jgi:hypothetical protein
LARSATITGQQTATLPDSSGLVQVANTKSTTADVTAALNSTTFVTVTGLSYLATDLIANGMYKLEFFAQVTHGAGFCKFQALAGSNLVYSVGSRILSSGGIVNAEAATGSNVINLGASASGTVTGRGVSATSTFKVGAANTTLAIQFAQNVSSGTASILLAGATVTLTRIS